MKKFILFTPIVLFSNFLGFSANVEAAGCSSHKNKNVKVECSLSDDNCDSNKLDKNSTKVEA